VVELVDALDSKSSTVRCVGSSPTGGTILPDCRSSKGGASPHIQQTGDADVTIWIDSLGESWTGGSVCGKKGGTGRYQRAASAANDNRRTAFMRIEVAA
jgi:hypothetical protein